MPTTVHKVSSTSKNVEVIQMFYENFSGLESLLDDIYDRPDPQIFNITHIFQVKKELAHWLSSIVPWRGIVRK